MIILYYITVVILISYEPSSFYLTKQAAVYMCVHMGVGGEVSCLCNELIF